MRISDWSSDVCSSDLFVARSREQLNIDIPYISAWGIAGPAFSTAAGPSANGILTRTTVTIDGPQDARRLKFIQSRSGERRVGKECVSPCRSRATQSH